MTIVVEGTLLSLSASAWLALLIELAIKGSLVLSAGWLINRSLMRAPAGARSLVWTSVFAAVVVMPVLQLVRMTIPVKHEAAPWISPLGGHSIQLHLEDRSAAASAASGVPATPQAVKAEPIGWRHQYRTVVWVWLGGLLVLLLRLLRDLAAGWWSLRTCRRLHAGELIQLVDQARVALRIERPVEVRLSTPERVPFVVGTRRPVLVLPVAAGGWSRQALRASVLHEMAHVKRDDYLRLVLLRLACAALWFNPLVWWCARRAMLEIEMACDDRVLASGTSAIDYARHLLGLAVTTRRSPRSHAAVVALAERRQLEERVTMILNPKSRRLTVSRAAALTCFALIMIVVLPLAAVQLVDCVTNDDAKSPATPAEPAAPAMAPVPPSEPALATPPQPAAVPKPDAAAAPNAEPALAAIPEPATAPTPAAVVAPVAEPALAAVPEPAVAPVAEPARQGRQPEARRPAPDTRLAPIARHQPPHRPAPVSRYPSLATPPEPAVAPQPDAALTPVSEPVPATRLRLPPPPAATTPWQAASQTLPAQQPALVEPSANGVWSVEPVSAESDEELSKLLEELLDHLRKAEKSDGRIHSDSIPTELIHKIFEKVIAAAPAGQLRARFVMDTGEHSFGVLIEKDHPDCNQPTVVGLHVPGPGDDHPDYMLTIRCGDEMGSHGDDTTS
jgi:beta-lactamase regulating signal transducer with metallopeptidase domain